MGESTYTARDLEDPEFAECFLTRRSVSLFEDHLELTLPASKDPFRRGFTLTIAASGDVACPVQALRYLFRWEATISVGQGKRSRVNSASYSPRRALLVADSLEIGLIPSVYHDSPRSYTRSITSAPASSSALVLAVGQVSFGVRSASFLHDLVWVFGSCSSAGWPRTGLLWLAGPGVGLAQSSICISTCTSSSSIAEH